MSIVLVSFKFKEQKSNNKADDFFKILEKYDHIRINRSCYIVSADDETLGVCENLKSYVDTEDNILITQLTQPTSSHGFLSEEHRAWFQKHHL